MSAGRSGAVERTCVGCRRRDPKASMIRVVRAPGGDVSVDVRGSAPGRGCYLHRDMACLTLAERRVAVARALRTVVSPEELANLRTMIEGLMQR
ncbi:MAG: YlxR family protein [Actinomycetota bacterium]